LKNVDQELIEKADRKLFQQFGLGLDCVGAEIQEDAEAHKADVHFDSLISVALLELLKQID
jgi:hypothetical protein